MWGERGALPWGIFMSSLGRILQRVRRRNQKHPASHLRSWQIIAASVLSFGGFGLVFALIPPFSMDALKIAAIVTFVAVIVAFWNWMTYDWWARLAISAILSLQVLGITARAWLGVPPSIWPWLFPTLLIYIAAWILPATMPRLSRLIWREQSAPQTRLGRALMALMIGLVPIVGGFGAGFGMFGSRFGEAQIVYIVLGILGTFSAAIISFATMYQLWPERPWAQKANPKSKGEVSG
jgi:hypothetical protein